MTSKGKDSAAEEEEEAILRQHHKNVRTQVEELVEKVGVIDCKTPDLQEYVNSLKENCKESSLLVNLAVLEHKEELKDLLIMYCKDSSIIINFAFLKQQLVFCPSPSIHAYCALVEQLKKK